jgi:hypothetical protein
MRRTVDLRLESNGGFINAPRHKTKRTVKRVGKRVVKKGRKMLSNTAKILYSHGLDKQAVCVF